MRNLPVSKMPTGIGNQKDNSRNKSVTITDVPKGAPRRARKKVRLLSYKIRAPGETGNNEIILVKIRAVKTAAKDIETPSPWNKE